MPDNDLYMDDIDIDIYIGSSLSICHMPLTFRFLFSIQILVFKILA